MKILKSAGLFVLFLTLFLGTREQVFSQDDTTASSSNFWKENFQFSGELGAYGELYSITGQDSRRPSSTARLFFRPTLSLFNAVSLNFDFLISTEGTSAKQNINQFGLHPVWSWGRAHLGDFSDMLSENSLNGILIRGAGLTINPGIFRLSAIGGFTKRAVAGGADDGSFDRYLYGGKLGIGTDAGTYVDLLFLRVRDDVNSLSQSTQQVTIDTTNPSSSQALAFQVKPQENLIGGIITNIHLFENAFIWKTEATGSVVTRDMTVQSDTILKIPEAITKIYRPNITSSADIAVTTSLNLNFSSTTIQTGYKYIGPGYSSLGVGSLLNDIQEMFFAPSFRIGVWSVSLNYSRQNDNLIKQKLNTTARNTISGNLSVQPVPMWFMTFLGNAQKMSNDATNDTNKIGFSTLMLGTNQMYMFAPGGIIQNILISYIYQKTGDDSPLRANTKSIIHSTNLSATFPLSLTISLSPSIGFVSSKITNSDATLTQTYGISAQHLALENKLTTTLSETASLLSGTKSFRTGLSSNYQWTGSLTVGVMFSMMNFKGDGSTGINFNEYTASLNISQRF